MPSSVAAVLLWPNQQRSEGERLLTENRIVSLCNQALEEQTGIMPQQRQDEYEAILEEPGT
jgi:hypothetical protein